ncbi:MAG: cephalosporin hydroxylase family protein [Promethearchaeota archaeon]
MKVKITYEGHDKEADIYTDEGLKLIADLWLKVSCHNKIMYEPTWLGIPIIQYPNDIVMMQELIWKVRPDVIVETGVAHGGSAILYASILELIGKGCVIGVDVEIRQYNRVAILSHPLSKRITLIEGNSVDLNIVKSIHKMIKGNSTILVVLDSDHSRGHVLKEMELYSQMVTPDSYMVVMDGAQGLVWDIPRGKDEWREDNPLQAIHDFLKVNHGWKIDEHYNRLYVSSNPSGFLRRSIEE